MGLRSCLRRRSLAAAALGCGVFVAACSLVVDTKGLSGGAAPTSDAGPSALPTSGDGAAAGLVDAGALDAQAGPFCGTRSLAAWSFCEDFDSLTSLPGAFLDGVSVSAGGRAALDTAQFRSPPKSFLSTVPAASCAVGSLNTHFGGNGARAGSIDVLFNAVSGAEESLFVFSRGSRSKTSTLYISAKGDSLAAIQGVTDLPLSIPITFGSWETLTFDVDLAGGRAEFSIGGRTGNVTLTPVTTSGDLSFELGFDCDPNPTPSAVNFDNVLLNPH